MKRLFSVIVITLFLSACGSGNDETTTTNEDSMSQAADSVMQAGDTSAMNGVMGDSTSASDGHGKGSGSRVGGGATGEAQGAHSKTADSASLFRGP